jgi:hypothetical protein
MPQHQHQLYDEKHDWTAGLQCCTCGSRRIFLGPDMRRNECRHTGNPARQPERLTFPAAGCAISRRIGSAKV